MVSRRNGPKSQGSKRGTEVTEGGGLLQDSEAPQLVLFPHHPLRYLHPPTSSPSLHTPHSNQQQQREWRNQTGYHNNANGRLFDHNKSSFPVATAPEPSVITPQILYASSEQQRPCSYRSFPLERGFPPPRFDATESTIR